MRLEVGDGVKLVGADELVQADGTRVGNGVVDELKKRSSSRLPQNISLPVKFPCMLKCGT